MKVVFCGSKHVGYKCLKLLHKRCKDLNFEISAVCTNHKNGLEIEEYCYDNQLPVMSIGDAVSGGCDLLIGVDVQDSVPSDVFLKCARAVNLRPGPLPEYRGFNQISHAIAEGSPVFGATIHILDETVDCGAIIAEDRWELSGDEWADDLRNETIVRLIILFKDNIEQIINGTYWPKSQTEYDRKSSYNNRDSIDELRIIDLYKDEKSIHRQIRATMMEGKQPPCCYIGDKKINLVLVNE